jgi:hypothetical protein
MALVDVATAVFSALRLLARHRHSQRVVVGKQVIEQFLPCPTLYQLAGFHYERRELSKWHFANASEGYTFRINRSLIGCQL